jgi:transcriptional regulator with XRE-family HTH domain
MDSTEAIRKLFGERVRYFRKLRGWQLDDLGARLNKSRGSLSRIENGKQNLTMVDIVTIAQALEVEVDELFRHSSGSEEGGKRLLGGETHAVVARCTEKGQAALHDLASVFHELGALVG